MSDILAQVNESAFIDVFFLKAGVRSTVTPDPDYELRRVDDDTLVDSGTLTAVGTGYPYTFSQANAALYRLWVTTSDPTADYVAFGEEIRVGQTWLERIDAALSTLATATNLTNARDAILAKLLRYTQLVLRNDAAIAADNATELAEINADEGSGAGSFANITDSQEAIADGLGGSAPTVQQIVNGLLDELLAGHATDETVGAAINLVFTVYGQLGSLGTVIATERDRSMAQSGRELVIGVDYSGTDVLRYTANTLRDLSAVGITVALEFTDNASVHHSFPAQMISGLPGVWVIEIAITADQTAELTPFEGQGELAVYENDVPKPRLGSIIPLVVSNNP